MTRVSSPDRRLAAALVAVMVFGGLQLAWIEVEFLGPGPTAMVDQFGGLAAVGVATAAAFWAAWRAGGRYRRGWTILALAGVAWLIGDTCWAWMAGVLRVPLSQGAYTNPAFIVGALLDIAGVTMLTDLRRPAASLVRILLDGVIVATSLFLVAYVIGLEPIVAAAKAPITIVVITLGYPTVDVLICTIALLGWTRVARSEWPPLLLLAGAFGFVAVSDSSVAFQLLLGSGGQPTFFDSGYLLAALLIAVAAWDTGSRRLGWAVPVTDASPLDPVVPFAAMGLALAGAIFRVFSGRPFAPEVQVLGIVILATSAIALVVHRHDLVQSLRREERARLLAEAQSHMLATVSHELRTPLNSVIGFAGLLSAPAVGTLNETQRRYARNIETAGNALLRLINESLDFSRLRAGAELHVLLAPMDVAVSVERVTETVAPLLAGRRLETRCAGSTLVTGDATRVEQILLNLVSNAINATDRTGRITISCRRSADMVEIEVADDGRGIAAEDQKRIFEEFVQASTVGTGLGLAVSRRLAEQMRGTLRVISAHGAGSKFTLRLPAA